MVSRDGHALDAAARPEVDLEDDDYFLVAGGFLLVIHLYVEVAERW